MIQSGRRLIVVLGVHRSGTSAITRGLPVLGVSLGNTLIDPLPNNNEKGFFEDAGVNALNEELLSAIDHSWHSLGLAQQELEAATLDFFAERAGRLLDDRFASTTRFAIKDPRVCRLLPFWKGVFASRDIAVDYLVTLRNPLEVSSSLAKRDGFQPEKSHSMWLEHLLAALGQTAGSRRVVVDYGNLMNGTDRELVRVARRFGLEFDPKSKAAREYREEYLDASLRHTSFGPQTLTASKTLSQLVVDAYSMMCDFACDRQDPDDAAGLTRVAEIEARWRDSWPALTCAHNAERRSMLVERELIASSEVASRSSLAVADLHAKVDSLHGEVAVRDRAIALLHAEVAQRDTAVATLQAEVRSTDRSRMPDAAAAPDDQAADSVGEPLRTEMAVRDERLAKLEEALAASGSRAASLTSIAGKFEERIAELDRVLAERAAEAESLAAKMATQEVRIATLARMLGDKTTEAESMRLSVATYEVRVAALHRTNDRKAVEAESLRQSAATHKARIALLDQALGEKADEALSLKSALTSLQAQVAELQRAVAEKVADTDSLRVALALRVSQAFNLEQTIAEKSGETDGLKSSVALLETRVATLGRVLLGKDAQIEALHAAAALLGADFGKVCNELAASVVARTELAATVAAQAGGLREMHREAEIAKQESRQKLEIIAGLEAQSGALRDRLDLFGRERIAQEWQAAALRQESRDCHDAADLLAAELEVSESALDGVRSSRSWRLTRPLRALRRLMAAWRAGARNERDIPAAKMQDRVESGLADHSAVADATTPAFHGVRLIGTQRRLGTPLFPPFVAQNALPIPARVDAMHGEAPIGLICFYETSMGTEDASWSVVDSVKPRFRGHIQPRKPGDLGSYGAGDESVLRRQVSLARKHGIGGFAFYFRWDGACMPGDERLRQMAREDGLDFPFCLCWREDSEDEHDSWAVPAFFGQLAAYVRHARYLRFRGRPILVIARPEMVTGNVLARWRVELRERNCGEVCIVGASNAGAGRIHLAGIDATIEMPPLDATLPMLPVEPLPGHESDHFDVRDWRVLVARSASYPEGENAVLFRGVCVGWDDSALMGRHATTLANATFCGYQEWLRNAVKDTCARLPQRADRFIFVNAWNDWTRCAYLEPDQRSGHAALEATSMALLCCALGSEAAPSARETSIAVVLHAYYPDIFEGLAARLDSITACALHLYVTCSEEGATRVRERLERGKHPYVLVLQPNRGRDILPFLDMMPRVLAAGHNLLLKAHTKNSTHRRDGARWRDDLIGALTTDSAIDAALTAFSADPRAGIICPQGHLLPMADHWDLNVAALAPLAERLGVGQPALRRLRFVAGSMFFARTRAFVPLLALALSEKDFEEEAGQVDGTLAHAIERAFSASAHAIGLTIGATATAVAADHAQLAMATSRRL